MPLQPADKAWLAIGGFALAWDILAQEMLSQASQRYRDAHPLLWPAVIVYTGGHLMHVWPEKYDLFTQSARLFGR